MQIKRGGVGWDCLLAYLPTCLLVLFLSLILRNIEIDILVEGLLHFLIQIHFMVSLSNVNYVVQNIESVINFIREIFTLVNIKRSIITKLIRINFEAALQHFFSGHRITSIIIILSDGNID